MRFIQHTDFWDLIVWANVGYGFMWLQFLLCDFAGCRGTLFLTTEGPYTLGIVPPFSTRVFDLLSSLFGRAIFVFSVYMWILRITFDILVFMLQRTS